MSVGVFYVWVWVWVRVGVWVYVRVLCVVLLLNAMRRVHLAEALCMRKRLCHVGV